MVKGIFSCFGAVVILRVRNIVQGESHPTPAIAKTWNKDLQESSLVVKWLGLGAGQKEKKKIYKRSPSALAYKTIYIIRQVRKMKKMDWDEVATLEARGASPCHCLGRGRVGSGGACGALCLSCRLTWSQSPVLPGLLICQGNLEAGNFM